MIRRKKITNTRVVMSQSIKSLSKIKLSFVCLILFLECFSSYAQTKNDDPVEIDMDKDLWDIINIVEENRIKKQSKILSYDNLPGIFWVMVEPYTIDEKQYFFQGYIFIDKNCVIEVAVKTNSNNSILEKLSLSPELYIRFINGMMTYKIIDEKITIMNKELCYLQDTFLYFFRDDGYKKYKLYDWFSIYDDQGGIVN